MNLVLNNVLGLTNEEVNNSKIEFNTTVGTGGEPFIDIWLHHTESEKAAGTCYDCSYWCGSTKKHNFRVGQWVFSFVRMSSEEWLFVSAAEIVEITSSALVRVNVLSRFVPLFGRLIIKCKRDTTRGAYSFNLNTYLGRAIVKEILPCLYSGEKFEGYDKVHLSYSKLADIFSGKILPTYYEALQKISGVYCLTDKTNGCMYIGSATGAGGVAQRWGNYLDSKHGGNKKLIELYNKEGDKYFEENFTFTLLEYYSLSYERDKIIEREQYWKKCFDTIKHGYNDN